MAITSLRVMTVFFLAVNLSSAMLITSGAAADMGLDSTVQVGADDKASETKQAANDIATGAPTGQTLFGLYNVLAGTVGTLGTIAFGGPQMFGNLGVPLWITNPMRAVIGVVYGYGVIQLLRGI